MKSMVGHSCPLRASDGSLFYICTITTILKNSLTSKKKKSKETSKHKGRIAGTVHSFVLSIYTYYRNTKTVLSIYRSTKTVGE